MEKLKVLIIHGAYGYPDENWFGWMKRELENCGVACEVPRFPTPKGQSLQKWLEIFNQGYGKTLCSDTILIGHSLGAAFILRWLERHQAYLRAVILAGAFIGRVGISKFDSLNMDFFSKPFNWNHIRAKSAQFICYHGDNDPYVSKAGFDLIADKLEAKKIIISQAGHLNKAAGYTQFHHLLVHLKQLMEQAQ